MFATFVKALRKPATVTAAVVAGGIGGVAVSEAEPSLDGGRGKVLVLSGQGILRSSRAIGTVRLADCRSP